MKVNGYEIKPEANLRGADLSGANLSRTDLSRADLSETNLRETNLSRADLSETNLRGADLRETNLSRANLRGANLRWADLRGADLREANLREADLFGANLYGADLRETDLSGTCLNHSNEANGDTAEFQQYKGRIIGYRSKVTPHVGEYYVGRVYGADFFSTSDTECHPGLYLWPTLLGARAWSGDSVKLIKVLADPEHTHKAGSKWRTRWFEVTEEIQHEQE